MDEEAIERRVTAKVCEKLAGVFENPVGNWRDVRASLTELARENAGPPWVTKALHVESRQDDGGPYWVVYRLRDRKGQRRCFYVSKGGNETDSTVPGQFGDEPHPVTRLRSWSQAQEAMTRAAAWEAAGR